MTDHDSLCPLVRFGNDVSLCPYCRVIAVTRADERERIARAIEEEHKNAPDCGPCSYLRSARIAREGVTQAQIAREGVTQ